MSIWELDPPLETERLLLREHRADDLDDLVVFHGDPAVTRYIPWPVRDREQTREALAKKLGPVRAAAPGDWIALAIEERATGTVIGEVLIKREDEGHAEVGYVIRTDRQGQGLATEAVVALLDTAADRFGVRVVEAVVVDGNDPSARLLERLGFVPVDHDLRTPEGEPMTKYRRG